ncbi:MAG: hypothetical protein AB1782_08195 [Cyanobacteriota bacterium]
MYKIAYNNFVLPVILLVITIVGGIGIEFATSSIIPSYNVNLILLLSVLPIFLIVTVVLYSKGKIQQYMAITGIMLLVYILSMGIISGICIAMGKQTMEHLDLHANPVTLGLPILMSIIIGKALISLKEVVLEVTKQDKPETPEISSQPESPPLQQPLESQPADNYSQQTADSLPEEPVMVKGYQEVKPKEPLSEPEHGTKSEEPPSLYDYDKNRPKAESQEEVFLEDLMEQKPEVVEEVKSEEPPSLYDYDKNRPKAESQEEVFFEDLMEQTPVDPFKQPEEKPSVPEEKPVIEEEPQQDLLLGDLPELGGDLGEVTDKPEPPKEKPVISISAEQSSENVSVSSDTEPEEEIVASQDLPHEPFDPNQKPVIPRLTDAPKKKDHESGGKITSIGKLLVDHRDIENIIETNALMQSVGSDATTTKIISAVAGGKTNEKLAALKEINGINSSVIVNAAGFIQASTLDDIHKEQVIGAMASGTFGIVSTSLTKLGFQPAKDVTLESNTGSIVLNKLSDNIITIFVDSDYSLYNLTELNEILVTAAERENNDLINTLASINGVIGAILSDGEGNLILSKLIDETKNAENIASMLPNFYANLGVFLKNMNLGSLRKTIVSTGNEVLLFTSLGNKILMLYVTLNTAIVANDVRIQYETIINT